MSPYRAFDTLAKALNPGESTACQSSVEGMEGNVHLIAGDSSINYIEKEGPLLSDSHVAFRVFLYICIYIYFIILMLVTILILIVLSKIKVYLLCF